MQAGEALRFPTRRATVGPMACDASLDRRSLLGWLGGTALAGLTGGCATPQRRAAPALAVTIDDFNVEDWPLLGAAARHDAILAALDRHRVRAAGFPAGKFVTGAEARHRLAQWAERGHSIGNHSYAHRYYGAGDPTEFAEDLDRAARLVSGYSTSVPLFRFPYLAEGRTEAARDGARAALAARGLRNAHVTIDTSDWYVSGRLVERLKSAPAADLGPYRRFYLAHLLDRARFYDRLALDLLGRRVAHTLLLHHNLATALFLDDALAMFRRAGWRLIDAAAAFADPVYAATPTIVPAGNSLIWQLAKEHGGFADRLRVPGEDGRYEKAAMDALGL